MKKQILILALATCIPTTRGVESSQITQPSVAQNLIIMFPDLYRSFVKPLQTVVTIYKKVQEDLKDIESGPERDFASKQLEKMKETILEVIDTIPELITESDPGSKREKREKLKRAYLKFYKYTHLRWDEDKQNDPIEDRVNENDGNIAFMKSLEAGFNNAFKFAFTTANTRPQQKQEDVRRWIDARKTIQNVSQEDLVNAVMRLSPNSTKELAEIIPTQNASQEDLVNAVMRLSPNGTKELAEIIQKNNNKKIDLGDVE